MNAACRFWLILLIQRNLLKNGSTGGSAYTVMFSCPLTFSPGCLYFSIYAEAFLSLSGAIMDTGGSKYRISLLRRRLITFCLRVGRGW